MRILKAKDKVQRGYLSIGVFEDKCGLHVMEQPFFIAVDLHHELRAHAYLQEHAVEQEVFIGVDKYLEWQ